ncbi:hypothetical protein OpiT1DRAFT_04718 [Opitutaceae bacterium TAV1]|nr:hypothetical protein OpiT1DRAFT_04718 [Opitutaceae bacterium TAV1]
MNLTKSHILTAGLAIAAVCFCICTKIHAEHENRLQYNLKNAIIDVETRLKLVLPVS